jgi:toxin ParE1/3/4
MAGTPAKFEVLLTEGAEQDLEAIHDYISEFDCVANANYVLDELMDVVESLSKFPERGSYPKELVGLGIKEYRQTFFKPYRVIYRVTGSQVIIYLIADGRRDMQSVLARRLLGRLTRGVPPPYAQARQVEKMAPHLRARPNLSLTADDQIPPRIRS